MPAIALTINMSKEADAFTLFISLYNRNGILLAYILNRKKNGRDYACIEIVWLWFASSRFKITTGTEHTHNQSYREKKAEYES